MQEQDEHHRDKRQRCDDSDDDEKGKEKEAPEPSEEPGPSVPVAKAKKFDLQSRQLFLTYPQCDIGKEDALLQLSSKLGDPAEYIVAQEEHEVGGWTHAEHCARAEAFAFHLSHYELDDDYIF